MEHLPRYEFQKCVSRYHGGHQQKSFSCWDQFLAMSFAQFTYRESLRDIEACLDSVGGKLYHMGFRSKVARSTLADANESRDWRIFADFAQVLIAPRWTSENRPYVDTSKPANGAEPEQEYLYPGEGHSGNHFFASEPGGVYTDLTWVEDTATQGCDRSAASAAGMARGGVSRSGSQAAILA
jgi:hypothetical protein